MAAQAALKELLKLEGSWKRKIGRAADAPSSMGGASWTSTSAALIEVILGGRQGVETLPVASMWDWRDRRWERLNFRPRID